jgi:hypothetical protein
MEAFTAYELFYCRLETLAYKQHSENKPLLCEQDLMTNAKVSTY